MINVIVPITENAAEFEKFVSSFKKEDVKFFVGITENLAKSWSLKNVELHIFKNGSKKEEMINSLHSCHLQKGRIMIARRPLSVQEFEKLSTSSFEIATLKKPHNKFVSFFKNMTRKLIKRVFAFEYFEDISAICYNEKMFELISVCSNLSKASRINKYVGVEVEEIFSQTKPVKKEYNRALNAFMFAFATLFFLGSIAGGILTCIFVPKLQALIVFLVICWIFVALLVQTVAMVSFARTLAVGTLHFGKAQQISVVYEEKQERKSAKVGAKKKASSKGSKKK